MIEGSRCLVPTVTGIRLSSRVLVWSAINGPSKITNATSAQTTLSASCKVVAPWIRGRSRPVLGTACQRAAYKHKGRCALRGGPSTGSRNQERVQRISEANLKHDRQTKDKLAAQRHAAKVGRRVRGELKQIERQIVDAGLTPDS